MSTEMEYVKYNIIPPNRKHENDITLWVSSLQGNVTVKSAWQIMRKKKEIITNFLLYME